MEILSEMPTSAKYIFYSMIKILKGRPKILNKNLFCHAGHSKNNLFRGKPGNNPSILVSLFPCIFESKLACNWI
jgi:hypothetical protein